MFRPHSSGIRPRHAFLPIALVLTTSVTAQEPVDTEQSPPARPGILETRLPDRGPVPSMVPGDVDSIEAPDARRSREWAGIVRSIRRAHFGDERRAERRQEGLDQLREITDSAAFQPMIEALQSEDDDVRLALIEHFAGQGEAGQAALAWIAVHAEDRPFRHEATLRMTPPVGDPVLAVLDRALRDTRHTVVSNAATLANALDVFEAIPLLIFNQATSDEYEDTGDLAWIAIGTQISYVQDLVPVVGSNVGAFNPIVGTVTQGSVLAIQDAVVVVYRTEVHVALNSLATRDWGRPTDHLGWDMRQWWAWYNEEYVPHRLARAEASAITVSGVRELVEQLDRERTANDSGLTAD